MEFISALAGEDLETSLADLVPEPIPEAKTPTLPPQEIETQAIDLAPERRRRRLVMWAVPAAAVIALVAEIGLLVGTAPATTPATGSPDEAAAPATLAASEGLIQTTPAGARVLVNDREVGSSPVAMGDLEPGEHRLRVELAGYAPTDFTFPVTAGAPMPKFNLNMEPLSAPLHVSTEPASALVSVDGLRLGVTPLDELTLPPGRHEVRVELKGYKPFVKTVSARAGEPIVVQAKLSPLPTPTPPADPLAIVAAAPPPVVPLPTPVPVFEGMFVPLSMVDVAPKKLSGAGARLSESARRRKGKVEVEMAITQFGQPTDVTIIQSAGPELDEAVRKAVLTWQYEPARKNGVRVRTRAKASMEFR
jgi:TonB family protein